MKSVTNMLRREDGAVAIEFVILAPLLFALLFGIVCVGYALSISHSVQQLASYTARVSVAGITQSERRDLAEAYLAQASSHYPLLTQSSVLPTVEFVQGAPAAIRVNVIYQLDGSVLGLANNMLGLNWSHVEGSAYLVY